MSLYNGLTDAQEERLRLLIEECAEVSQAACKVIRFGYHYNYNGGIDNKTSLEHELGDLSLIQTVMQERGDISQFNIATRQVSKRLKINTFLQYQLF